MANPKNVSGQPGHGDSIPQVEFDGGTPGHQFPARGWDGYGRTSKNIDGQSSGDPEVNGDGDSKYTTGYGHMPDTSNPNPRPGSGVPAAGVSEDPRHGKRHTGYVLDEGQRGASVQRHDLVDGPPKKVK